MAIQSLAQAERRLGCSDYPAEVVKEPKMTGAEILIRALQEEGVEVIFGYPGGAVLPIYDALYASSIRHVRCRHEQGAAHAADGYSRATGKVGVCLATSGPGATNLVTGIATAFMDSIPMVAITGQVPTSLIGKDSFQEVDIVGITMPIVKHSYSIRNVADIARVVKEAFYVARTGRPGPVVIDVPKDAASQTAPYVDPGRPRPRGYSPRYEGDLRAVAEAAHFIARAERPVVLVGGGVISSDTSRWARKLVEIVGAPVVLSMMGLGAVDSDHPLCLGMVGMHGTYAANMAVTHCDLLVGVGVRFDDRVTGNVGRFAPNASIIHMDVDAAEMNKNVKPTVRVVGDLRWSLPTLIEALEAEGCAASRATEKSRQRWREKVTSWKDTAPPTYPNGDDARSRDRIAPQHVIWEIWKATGGKAVVATDVGQHQMWTAQCYRFRRPRSFISSGGLGTMGFGLPAAIGAKIGLPGESVWLISGDGSFLMNCQELATLKEANVDLKIVVLNNQCLGMVRQWQEFFFERRYSHSLFQDGCGVNYAGLAQAFGIPARRLDEPSRVRRAIEDAAASDGPVLLEFMIEGEANVLPMVPAGGALDEMLGLV